MDRERRISFPAAQESLHRLYAALASFLETQVGPARIGAQTAEICGARISGQRGRIRAVHFD